MLIGFSCSLSQNNNDYRVVISDSKTGWYYLFFVIDTPLNNQNTFYLIDSNYVCINIDTNIAKANINLTDQNGNDIKHRAVLLKGSASSIKKDSITYLKFFIPQKGEDYSKYIDNGELNLTLLDIESKSSNEYWRLLNKIQKRIRDRKN
jgi:hypothetical protein